jgi:hypothetical protein
LGNWGIFRKNDRVEMEFKLDRNAFRAGQAKDQVNYGMEYRGKSTSELIEIAMFLNSIAYGFDPQNPPRMDRTVFSVRKQADK